MPQLRPRPGQHAALINGSPGGLGNLPAEILHSILSSTTPTDLARIRLCCRSLRDFVDGDRQLWRELYLALFDPPLGNARSDFAWVSELQWFVRIQHILKSDDEELKWRCIHEIAHTVDELLRSAAMDHRYSRNVEFLARHVPYRKSSEAIVNYSCLARWTNSKISSDVRTTSLRRGRPASSSKPACYEYPRSTQESQLSAKMNCLRGIAADREPTFAERQLKAACARSRVFDIEVYTMTQLWGPFRQSDFPNSEDVQVDWDRVEALMYILAWNLKESNSISRNLLRLLPDCWDMPFAGVTPDSFEAPLKPMSTSRKSLLEAQDPYKITGKWMRVICFLDYNEFHEFNFTGDPTLGSGYARPPLRAAEETMFILMELEVQSIEPLRPQESLPVVHIKGFAYQGERPSDLNSRSRVKGTVSLTYDGEVKWVVDTTLTSGERWGCEGVQIGGINSARGVVGTWFDGDRDIIGPVGPTAFWKLHNDIEATEDLDDA